MEGMNQVVDLDAKAALVDAIIENPFFSYLVFALSLHQDIRGDEEAHGATAALHYLTSLQEGGLEGVWMGPGPREEIGGRGRL